MGLAVYVHIPYCLQRCRYCDFTTFEWNQILPPPEYVALIKDEIRHRHRFMPSHDLISVYFGGGTPSLIQAELIVSILDELANAGFRRSMETEITIEINPATIERDKLRIYLEAGINRFSVGAQTFDDPLLKLCGRRHTADDTRKTLDLLATEDLNYSFDLLFALPGQTRAGLRADLAEVQRFSPRHLSAYCLTVPDGHPMSSGRPPEGEQLAMFSMIENRLSEVSLRKYEISNFAKPGFESVHNWVYWSDKPYWGLGVSAHSYLPLGDWGTRFWNPKSIKEYAKQVRRPSTGGTFPDPFLEPDQYESLKFHEALTDYSHTFLRTMQGLNLTALRNKFGENATAAVHERLLPLLAQGWVQQSGPWIQLTQVGETLSNQVFSGLLFTDADAKKVSGFPPLELGVAIESGLK